VDEGSLDEMPTAPAEPGQSLESRLQRLDDIVNSLEADEVELDRALALFEEGIGHVRDAERILSEAELKVEELVRQAGDVGTRPLEAEDE
jgi:exodeoxyribonuclease VII small subunit